MPLYDLVNAILCYLLYITLGFLKGVYFILLDKKTVMLFGIFNHNPGVMRCSAAEATGPGFFFCFVLNPCVLQANRVDFEFFCCYYPSITPPSNWKVLLQSLRLIHPLRHQPSLSYVWCGGSMDCEFRREDRHFPIFYFSIVWKESGVSAQWGCQLKLIWFIFGLANHV